MRNKRLQSIGYRTSAGKEALKDWIEKYFQARENLSLFYREDTEFLIFLTCFDSSKGYVFTNERAERRNYKSIIENALELHRDSKNISLQFIDHLAKRAGFSWRQING